MVGVGKPELILARIAAKVASAAASTDGASVVLNVVCQEEVCLEELSVNDAVCTALGLTTVSTDTNTNSASNNSNGDKYKSQSNFETVWGSTLYDPITTLPLFDGAIPDTFTPFRKEVEKSCKIGVPLNVPSDDQLKLPLSHNVHNIILNERGDGCCCSLDYMPTLADFGYNTQDIESITLPPVIDPRCALSKGYRGGETLFALSRVQ